MAAAPILRFSYMNICVYCASSSQVPEVYMKCARQLGTLLAQGGHTLVNGAGHTGLMGASTDAVLAAGGEVVGVIPQFMVEQGWHHSGLTRLEIVADMHTRKQRMASLSDACIALPGGVGTLEELCRMEDRVMERMGPKLCQALADSNAAFARALADEVRREP